MGCRFIAVISTVALLHIIASAGTAFWYVRNSYASSPESDTENWAMMGALTSSGVTFRLRLVDDKDSQLKIRDTNGHIVWNTTIPPKEDAPTSTVSVNDLLPGTRYTYSVTSASSVRGSFQTAPADRQRFTFAAAGCAWTGSTSSVFTSIASNPRYSAATKVKNGTDGEDLQPPLFFVHMGDFHYEDLNTVDMEPRVQAVDRVLNSPSQNNLFHNAPLVYMWDDHDFLGNNLDGTGTGRDTALESYRLLFPHYPLAHEQSALDVETENRNATASSVGSSPEGLYHAFTIAGAVRFIVSDLRSEANSAEQRRYSEKQKRWLFDELSKSFQYDFVIWVTPSPWIGPAKESDAWWGFEEDRQELSEYISSSAVANNVLAISSDAHMLAFDDGSNTYYGNADQNNGASTNLSDIKSFPILQTGPMDRLGSAKGGPFSDGCHAMEWERNHQYTTVEYNPDGPCLILRAYRHTEGSDDDELIFRKDLCGTDIFGTAQPGVGTCTAHQMHTQNWLLLGAGLGLLSLAVIMGAMCGKPRERTALLGGCCIMWVAYILTLAVGVAVPIYGFGVKQFDVFFNGLIGLALALWANLCVAASIILARRKSRKLREEFYQT